MRPYATATDLAGDPDSGQVAWLSAGQIAELGDDADRVLARATELVAEHVTTGYTVDDTGGPADVDVKAALRDACCAQVEQWAEVGEENDVAGYSRSTAMGSNGLSLSSLPAVLAPRARRILRLAGLNSAVAY